jgi:hypothetical protein
MPSNFVLRFETPPKIARIVINPSPICARGPGALPLTAVGSIMIV